MKDAWWTGEQRTRPLDWALALLLIGLAAVPRTIRPDLSEYKLDEATVVLNALAIVREHVLPLRGQASSIPGLSHSPLLYYLVAPFLALQPDPRTAVEAIAVANSLAVGLAYLTLSRTFGRRIALLSAVLFASGSWAIIFSRKIWSIDLLAPLSVIVLWGLFRAIDPATRTPGLGRSWAALAVMIALNYSAWPLVLVVGLVQAVDRRTRQRSALRWSIAGGALFLVPLAALAPGLLSIAGRLPGVSAQHAIPALTPFVFVTQLADPTGFLVLAGPSHAFASEVAPLGALAPVVRALLVLGVALAVWRAATRAAVLPRRHGALGRLAPWSDAAPSGGRLGPELVVLCWWLVPALVSAFTGLTVYLHHFVDTLPAQFVLVALGIDGVARAVGAMLSRPWRAGWLLAPAHLTIAGAVSLLIAGAQLWAFARYLPFVETHPLGTFFGVPLHYDLLAGRVVRDAAASGRPVVALSSDGDTVGVAEAPTILASVVQTESAPASIQFADPDRTLLFPASRQTTYLLDRTSQDRLDQALEPWRAPDGPLPPSTEVIGGGYEEVDGTNAGDWLPAHWQRLEAPLEDESTVVGYTAPRQLEPGHPTRVAVAWRVGSPPADPRAQSVFAHVVDDHDQSKAGQDFAPVPSSQWQRGELVVNRFTLTPPKSLPPGRYWIDFGRYSRPGIQPVRVVSRGKPGATSVRLGPLAVPPPPRVVTGLTPTGAVFGDAIRLLGWKVQQTGATLRVVLVWQASKPPAASYTVFVHLLTPAGRLAAQNDSEPRQGQFPTSTWKAGDQVVDSHAIALAGVAPGRYELETGLYLARSGQRLSTGRADHLLLGFVQLTAPVPPRPVAQPSPTSTPRPAAGRPTPRPTLTPTPRPSPGQASAAKG